jgi:predicted SprT family Zn-dependent metalloprotease
LIRSAAELVQLKVNGAVYHCDCGANVFKPSETDTKGTHYDCHACRRG